MKTHFRLLLLLLITGIASCNNIKNKVTGKWFVEDVAADFPAFQQLPAEMQQRYRDQLKHDLEQQRGKSYMDFRKDGVMEARMGKDAVMGTWDIVGKNKLIIRPDATKFADTLPIEITDKGLLRLKMASPMGEMTLTMKKGGSR